MFECSESLDKLVPALLKLQNDFTVIAKTAKGQNNQYTPYDELIAYAKSRFTKVDILLLQPIVYVGNPPVNAIYTRLQLEDQFIASTSIVRSNQVMSKDGKPTQSEATAEGGGITYTKRYSLTAMLAWATGEKDIDSATIDSQDNKLSAAKAEITELIHAKCESPDLAEKMIADIDPITSYEKIRLLYPKARDAFQTNTPAKLWQIAVDTIL